MAEKREQGERKLVFTMEAAKLKFGRGAVEELGWDLGRLGLARIFVVADHGLRKFEILNRIGSILSSAGIAATFFEDIGVEPTLASLGHAAEAVKGLDIDGFVAVGGGSTIDTAKVANLIHCHGGAIMDYVNPPIGAGRKPPSPLKPLVAIPTTSGSGSEATTVAVLDLPELRVKTGISHRFLRSYARHRRSGTDAHDTGGGHRLNGTRCGVPRRRVLYRQAVPYASASCKPRRPAALSGQQPGGRHLVGQGDRVRWTVPRPRGARRR